MKAILISNSFPFSLIRREVRVVPRTQSDLHQAIAAGTWVSAWGHSNTLAAASAIAGVDLTPATARPAISLSADGLPAMDGHQFEECWLLSPEYTPGFRPQIGEEVSPENIKNWQVLQLIWKTNEILK